MIGADLTNLEGDVFLICPRLTNVFFTGNAPAVPAGGAKEFDFDTKAAVYYLPGNAGWSNTFAGVPALLWNPLIQTNAGSFGRRNNLFEFNIAGTTNIPIVVEAGVGLANSVWTPLTNVNLTNGLFHFSETLQTNSASRFYRISSP